MNYFKSLSRLVSTLTVTTLAFAFVAVPIASAAYVAFDAQNNLDKVFNINSESTIDFDVSIKNYVKDSNVGFTIRGPLGENNEQTQLKSIHNYTSNNESHTFSWNGQLFDQDVVPGTYRAEFSNIDLDPNPLTYDFEVVTGEPMLDYTDGSPDTQHSKSDGDYSVSIDMTDLKAQTEVTAYMVIGDNNLHIPKASFNYGTNNSHVFSWSVNDIQPGTYDVYIYGTDTEGNPTNELKYALTVSEAHGVLDFNPDPDNTHTSGSGDYKLSVALTGFTSDTLVTVSLLNNENNLYVPVDNFTYTSASTHTFAIPTDNLKVGETYKFRVSGKDKDNVTTNDLDDSFKMLEAEILPTPSDHCADFPDLPANYKYCDEVEFVSDAGIITGEGNGNFNANGNVLRATAAKIALESVGLYSASKDYCADLPASDKLKDITTKSAKWYNNYVCRGLFLGMITGYEAPSPNAGYYLPGNDVSIAEGTKLILESIDANMPSANADTYDNFDKGKWYSSYAAFAYENDLFDDMDITPNEPMTRIQMAVMLYRLDQMNYL